MKYNPDIHHRRSIRLRGYDYSQNGLYFITICTQNREHLFGTITNGQMALNPTGEIAHNEWFKTESMRLNIRLHEFIVMPNHIHGIIEIIPAPYPIRADAIRPNDAPPTTDNHGQSELGGGQHAGDIVRADCIRPLAPLDMATNNNPQSESSEQLGRVQRAGDMPQSEQLGRVQRAPTDATIDRHGQRAPTVGDIVRGYKSAVTKRINVLRNTPGLPVWQRNYHEHIIRNETAYLKIAAYTQTNPQRWQEDTYHV